VRDFEERHSKVFDGAGLFWGNRVRAERLTDTRGGVDLDIAFAHQSSDAASVVGVSVGQQDGVYVGQGPADMGEEGTYAPWREPGVDEEAA
jgi:hypothetical protein